MQTIYKYPLHIDKLNQVEMPIDAQIMCVQAQSDIPCVWVLFDKEDEKTEKRVFEIYGTGHDIQPMKGLFRDYLGTVQTHNGALVWHIFELRNY